MPRRRVYLAQPNHQYGRNVFLPYSVGLLQAYAQSQPDLAAAYEFPEMLFLREPAEAVAARWADADVVGLSCYVWNEQYLLALAEAIKAANPSCLVVMGGPQVPTKVPDDWFARHPHLDVLVHYEGEETFAEVLRACLGSTPDFSTILGVTVNVVGRAVSTPLRERKKDLSHLPSPYLVGLFDGFFVRHPDLDFHGTSETARGCPFSCFGGTTIFALPDRLVRPDEEEYHTERLPCPDHGSAHEHHAGSRDARLITQGTRACTRIYLSNGLSLVATPDQLVTRVYDDRLQEVAARALREGDWLAVEVGQNNVTEEVVLDTPSMDIYAPGIGRRRPNEIRIPKTLTADLAWWVGYLVGDGCLPADGRAGVAFAVTPSIKARLTRLTRELFDLPLRCYKSSTSTKIENGCVDSRMLVRFLRESLGVGVKEEKLRVPHALWRSPAGVVRAFLEGLWDADGHQPRYGEPFLTTISRQLAEECAAALHWIGDAAVVRRYERPPGRFPQGTPSPGGWCWRVEHHSRDCRDRKVGRPCVASAIPTKMSLRRRQKGPLKGKLYFSPSARQGEEARVSRWALRELAPEHELLDENLVFTRVTDIEDAGELAVYDVHNHPKHTVAANGILSHNCSFCDWGGAAYTKLGRFSDERVRAEYDWMAAHRIELLYNADANFMMLPRDVALTDYLIDLKRRTGWPKQIRAAWAKISSDRLFEPAKRLHDAGMDKGVTLALQSLHPPTLEAIERANIKFDSFSDLVGKYQAEGMPVYVEFILALPLETYDTFTAGICKTLEAGLDDGLNVYLCMILPNSEMGDPEYRKRYGMQTVRAPLLQQHASPDLSGPVEQADIVVGTSTMPHGSFVRAYAFAWVVQTFHGMGLLRETARWWVGEGAQGRHPGGTYSTFYTKLLEWTGQPGTVFHEVARRTMSQFFRGLEGHGWDRSDPRYGPVTWPLEEIAFLDVVSGDLDRFYREVGAKFGVPRDVLRADQEGLRTPEEFSGDLVEYAKQVVWYGRKGGKFRKDPAPKAEVA